MQTETVNLVKEQETMLFTLYAKALESRSKWAIFRDPWAELAVSKIKNDFKKFNVGQKESLFLALRARIFDLATEEFLRNHAEATVLNLGCGLDSRVHRVNPAGSVGWYDVDYPAVVDLRQRLYPARAGYHLVAAPLSELEWLDKVENDRPALIMAEGVTMYLTENIMRRLLNRVVDRFPSGRILFNAFGKLLVRLMSRSTVRGTGAAFHWGISTPRQVIRLEPRLCFDSLLKATDLPEFRRLSLSDRMKVRLLNLIPVVGKTQQPLLYRFPRPKESAKTENSVLGSSN
ncbi:MAG TPA: class I SAM-dependent methyltransferase [Chitinivibrionales bacterium]|nr:class I SAM-dependent methyltransferase [Chitinivibrionales bacterium]